MVGIKFRKGDGAFLILFGGWSFAPRNFMRKKLFRALLTLVMVFGLSVGTLSVSFAQGQWENPFCDVDEGAWYYDDVVYAKQNGLFAGTSSTTFEPDRTMTRAMLVTVLYNLEGSPMDAEPCSFTDVPQNQWYTDAVNWAAANQITSGVGDMRFAPNDSLTREQMIVFFYQYAQYKGYDVDALDSLDCYSDSETISDYAIRAFQWAVGAEIIHGTSDTTLSPKYSGTRAQVATVLHQFVQAYNISYPAAAYLDMPEIASIKNTADGIKITWNAVDGATDYRVFKKTAESSWASVTDTTATQFTDPDVTNGTTYTYTVRCVSSDGEYTSGYNSVGSTIVFIPTPSLKTAELVDGAVRLSWDQPVVGVDSKEQVYRKSGNGDWELVGETRNCFYVDKTISYGTTYVYSVRRIAVESGCVSGMDSTGISIACKIATPQITVAESSDGEIRLGWDSVPGVSLYRVFYRDGSGNWVKLDDTGLSRMTIKEINGKSLNVGSSYTFTVRCVSTDGSSYISDYDQVGTTVQVIGNGSFELDSSGQYHYSVNGVFQPNANGTFLGSVNGQSGLWYVEDGSLCTSTYTHSPFVAAIGYVSNNGTAYYVEEGTGEADEYAERMLDLINQERTANGLKPVSLDAQLTKIAEIRANDLTVYYSHSRPNGDIWFSLFGELNCDYSTKISEICAKNCGTCELAIYGWMHNTTHKNILLGEDFTRVGLAYVYDPSDSVYGYHWSVIFDKSITPG